MFASFCSVTSIQSLISKSFFLIDYFRHWNGSQKAHSLVQQVSMLNCWKTNHSTTLRNRTKDTRTSRLAMADPLTGLLQKKKQTAAQLKWLELVNSVDGSWFRKCRGNVRVTCMLVMCFCIHDAQMQSWWSFYINIMYKQPFVDVLWCIGCVPLCKLLWNY